MTTVLLPPVADSFHVVHGKVRVSQMLQLPVEPACASDIADRIAAANTHYLVDMYADSITRLTLGVVRLVGRGGDLDFSLTAHGPSILRLRMQEDGQLLPGAVTALFRIVGGLATVAAARDGILVLRLELRHGLAPTGVALEADVLVDRYEPLLLALPLPQKVRIALYRATQARLHRAITTAFLKALITQVVRCPSSAALVESAPIHPR